MSLKEFIKKTMIEYFIITTCITLAMAILGLIIEPEVRFGYEAFFYPPLYGLVSLIPAIITYSAKELSFRQFIIRKVLDFAGILLLLTIIMKTGGKLQEKGELIIFALGVGIVYLAVNLISWLSLRKTADTINESLKQLQAIER